MVSFLGICLLCFFTPLIDPCFLFEAIRMSNEMLHDPVSISRGSVFNVPVGSVAHSCFFPGQKPVQ